MDWIDLFTIDPGHDLYVTVALISALILGPMIAEVRARRFSIWQLKTVFLVFILFQFAIWPSIMYIPRSEQAFTFPLTFYTSRYDDFLKGQYCVIGGLIAFYVGYGRKSIPYDDVVRNRWWDRQAPLSEKRLKATFWACVAMTSSAFAVMMMTNGGVLYFLQNIDTLRTTAAQGWGVYLLPLEACQVGFTLCVAEAMRSKRSLALPLAGTALQVLCGFVIGQRALLIAPIVGLVLAYHFHVRPVRLTWRMGLGLIAFLAFNMWYGVFRGTGDASLDIIGNVPVEVFLLALFGRFHGGESLARVVDYTDHTGYNYGLPYVQDFLVQSVPRFLFPEKTAIGVTENVTFFPEAFTTADTGSAVPTLMGELYWGFGFVAIVAVLYLHGRFFRRVEDDAKTPSAVQTTIYWAVFIYALFANETISYHIWALAFRLVVLAILLALIRTRKFASSPSSSAADANPSVTIA